MKRIIFKLLIGYLSIVSATTNTQITTYDVVSPAQEKIRVTLNQMRATFHWLDQGYAARQRYYLSNVAFEFIQKQKSKFQSIAESISIFNKLENFAKTLHDKCLDLTRQDLDTLLCEAHEIIEVYCFIDIAAHKSLLS